MRATFVHTADNHLGYEQYGLKERFNDFAKAFLSVVDAAIERQADAFLIAGDLFNKRAIDAMTLMQAQEGLQRLKDAGIPAIAIEGNHDRTYYRDGTSWLQFLCWNKLLYLLNPLVREGVPALTPWDPDQLRGAYVDLQGGKLRVYGLPWYGTSTARVMEGFARELAAARADGREAGVEYRLLLMHTGVDGIVPQLHGLPSYEQFSPCAAWWTISRSGTSTSTMCAIIGSSIPARRRPGARRRARGTAATSSELSRPTLPRGSRSTPSSTWAIRDAHSCASPCA